jgi:hypothetical protein
MKKKDPNEIVDLVVLSALTVKWVIGFGRFVRILDDQWK